MRFRWIHFIEKPTEGQIAIPTSFFISYNRYRRRKYIPQVGRDWLFGYQYKYTVWINLWLFYISFKFMGRIHREGT